MSNLSVNKTRIAKSTQICPFGRSKFNLYEAYIKSDRVNLVALAGLVHRVRYITNLDQKG